MGYEDPNKISQDILEREQNVTSVVKYLDPEDEIVTRVSLYNFAMLNSPETCYLRKTLISPN